jgi:hypothetical protein
LKIRIDIQHEGTADAAPAQGPIRMQTIGFLTKIPKAQAFFRRLQSTAPIAKNYIVYRRGSRNGGVV